MRDPKPEIRNPNPIRNSNFGRRICPRNRGAIHWAILAFLLGFSVLLVILIWYYLIPAGEAAKAASQADKAKLRAVSTLLLAVVLFILFVGLLLIFRAGRFFFPKPLAKRGKTEYVDVWAESGKRLQVPPRDGDGPA